MGIKSIHWGCSIKSLEEHYHLPHEVVKIKKHTLLGCSIKKLEEHYHLPHEVDFTRFLSLFATLEPCVVFIAFLAQAKLTTTHPFSMFVSWLPHTQTNAITYSKICKTKPYKKAIPTN
jgi:hypothetical protein